MKADKTLDQVNFALFCVLQVYLSVKVKWWIGKSEKNL